MVLHYPRIRGSNAYNMWMLSFVLLLFVQYVRPQEMLPALASIRPYAIMSIALVVFLILFEKGNALQLGYTQIKIFWGIIAYYLFLFPFSFSKGLAKDGIINLLLLAPFLLSAVSLIRRKETLKLVCVAMGVMTVIIGVRGIMLHDGNYKNAMFNLGNFLSDPNDFSLFMNMMLPFCYFMMLYEKRSLFFKCLFALGAGLAFYTSVISFSRGGFIGLVATLSVMLYLSPNRKILSVYATAAAIFVIIAIGPTYVETMSTSLDTGQATAQTRLTTWNASWDMFVERPWGFGMTNGPASIYLFVPEKDHPIEYWGSVSHSLWLTFLSEGGIIVFTLFAMLLFYNIKQCLVMVRCKLGGDNFNFLRCFGSAAIASITGFCISGTFLTVNYYPHIWYISAIISGAFFVFKKTIRTKAILG